MRIESHRVRQLGRALDVPEHEVGAQARSQGAAILQAQGLRRMRVTPASASSGVSLNKVQAILSMSSSEVHGELPGLQSVDTAMGTPCSRSSATGGRRVSRRK